MLKLPGRIRYPWHDNGESQWCLPSNSVIPTISVKLLFVYITTKYQTNASVTRGMQTSTPTTVVNAIKTRVASRS